jgi:hypothetical protein
MLSRNRSDGLYQDGLCKVFHSRRRRTDESMRDNMRRFLYRAFFSPAGMKRRSITAFADHTATVASSAKGELHQTSICSAITGAYARAVTGVYAGAHFDEVGQCSTEVGRSRRRSAIGPSRQFGDRPDLPLLNGKVDLRAWQRAVGSRASTSPAPERLSPDGSNVIAKSQRSVPDCRNDVATLGARRVGCAGYSLVGPARLGCRRRL